MEIFLGMCVEGVQGGGIGVEGGHVWCDAVVVGSFGGNF